MSNYHFPKPILDKWLEALRSGKYQQGHHYLKDKNGGYCCLGVLQHILSGEVEYGDGGDVRCYPSNEWALDHELLKTPQEIRFDPRVHVYSKTLEEVVYEHVSYLNDQKVPFEEIADALEKEYGEKS